MRYVLFYSIVLFWFFANQAFSICKSKENGALSCGYTQKAQALNYQSLFHEIAKNSVLEEHLTTVDSDGIHTNPYQGVLSEAPNQDPIVININTEVAHQTMLGFGAAITDSCLENLKKLSVAEKKDFFEKVFDKRKGAGFSYLRVPIGANDFSKGDYTLNDTVENKPDPKLKAFDPKKLHDFIVFIEEAKKYNPDIKLIISPWSAPAWMKDTKALKGGQIKKEYYESYSNYLLKTINAFESNGIQIDQMTILNEPLIGEAKTKWGFPQTYMSPEDQNSFIKNNLSPKLKGKKTKILVHDHNWDLALAADTILAKNRNNSAVQGLAYHCYGGNLSVLKQNLLKHPGVPAFNTECTSTLNRSSDQDTFNWWQSTQSLDAVKAGVSGSLGWNLCLDENGGPRNNGCRACRGLITINSKTNAVSFNPEFKALATTSKVIDVGSLRLESNESEAGVVSMAFKNPDSSLSLVLKNKTKSSQVYNINIDDCVTKQYILPAGATLSARWFPN